MPNAGKHDIHKKLGLVAKLAIARAQRDRGERGRKLSDVIKSLRRTIQVRTYGRQSLMKKRLKKIPRFTSEDEERQFWATHDTTDYIEYSKAVWVSFPNLKPTARTDATRLPLPHGKKQRGLRSKEGSRSETRQPDLGAMLRLARERAGVTQNALARKLRTTPSAISRIENCPDDFTLSTLRRYAVAVGMHLTIKLLDEKST